MQAQPVAKPKANFSKNCTFLDAFTMMKRTNEEKTPIRAIITLLIGKDTNSPQVEHVA